MKYEFINFLVKMARSHEYVRAQGNLLKEDAFPNTAARFSLP